jgi:hypothetical protein
VHIGFQPIPGACSNNPCSTDNIAPVVVAKNITVQLNASGNASIVPVDIIQSVTDNCDPNPVVHLSRSTFSCADKTITGVTGGSSNHQAYSSPLTTGNQGWQGEMGMEFSVNNPAGIVVKQLGAFDHQGNGITGTQGGGVRVVVFNKATHTIVTGLDVIISGNADGYTGNYRMKNITPVTLLQGNYVIVAKGYNANELNGNHIIPGQPEYGLDNSNGAITFIESSYSDDNPSGFSYPQYTYAPSPNVFLAGTFLYDVPGSGNGGSSPIVVTIIATDSKGNTATATANVTILDPVGACSNNPSKVKSPVIANKNQRPEMFIENHDLKVYPNPTTGQFTLELFEEKGATTIQVMDNNGKVVEQKIVDVNSKSVVVRAVFNLSNKSPGMYFIKAISSTGIRSAKVMVNR